MLSDLSGGFKIFLDKKPNREVEAPTYSSFPVIHKVGNVDIFVFA